MRRSDLIAGTKNIFSSIKQCGLQEAIERQFDRLRSSHNDKELAIDVEVLAALNAFSLEVAKLGTIERQILSILQLDDLAEAKKWPAYFSPRNEALFTVRNRLLQASSFLPKIIALVEQDYVEVMKHDTAKAPPELQGKAMLTVIVLEEKAVYSSPHRIIETLESIELLYDAVAILEGERVEQKMILLACDSGSDKSFDLLGIAKLVDAVKEIILSLWDRIVFFREQKMGAKLELIAQSLPIIERIADMEKRGQLQREQAEILRRNITSGAEKFINAGAIIPEIENHSHYNPRQLMSPEPKLLAMPSTASTQAGEACPPASSQKPIADDDLNPEDREEFERLFKQMKRKKKQKLSDKPPEAGTGS